MRLVVHRGELVPGTVLIPYVSPPSLPRGLTISSLVWWVVISVMHSDAQVVVLERVGKLEPRIKIVDRITYMNACEVADFTPR